MSNFKGSRASGTLLARLTPYFRGTSQTSWRQNALGNWVEFDPCQTPYSEHGTLLWIGAQPPALLAPARARVAI
jgi:hypothetical protein